MLSRVVIVDAWNGGKGIADASQRHPAARTQNPFFQTKRQSEEVDSPQSIHYSCVSLLQRIFLSGQQYSMLRPNPLTATLSSVQVISSARRMH